jgi:hypothetical protein
MNLPKVITEQEDPYGMKYVAGFFAFRNKERVKKFGKLLSTINLLRLCEWMKNASK